MTQSTGSTTDVKQHKSQPFPLGLLAIVVILVLLALAGLFFSSSSDIAKDGKISDKEAAALLTDIRILIQIPQEKPVMALITNADTLIKEQAFYQGVSNGDVLVIFPQTRKAVLYSPQHKKLINVGPINLGDASQSATPQDQTTYTPVDESTDMRPLSN